MSKTIADLGRDGLSDARAGFGLTNMVIVCVSKRVRSFTRAMANNEGKLHSRSNSLSMM